VAAEATSPAQQSDLSHRDAPPPVPTGRIARPIAFTEEELGLVRFSGDGLVPAVVQDASDGEVLMLGYMDVEALRRTLSTGRTWFWSRSRKDYWCKGETSGDRQWVRAVRYDCDGDTLLVVVDQDGHGACHTGARSCFYRSFGALDDDGADRAAPARG
jgi:phosphoribosyl-AMP cyclohydrolase